MPIARLTSKPYADELRRGVALERASKSSPQSFTWPAESPQTTHLSIVDARRNAVSLTFLSDPRAQYRKGAQSP